MEHYDNLRNPIKEGDIVLILVPKTRASYRKAIVRGFRDERTIGKDFQYCMVLVEYDDGRLYCDYAHYDARNYTGVRPDIHFASKPIKAWRLNTDIIKFDQKYFD